MPVTAKIPPGRAGRMWLRRRLQAATRGRDQLDRKLRILIPERQRLNIQAQQRDTAWRTACHDAQTWLLRAVLLGGQDATRTATASHPVDVETTWTAAMGVSYPTGIRILAPAGEPRAAPTNAAVPAAASAYRAALVAGALVAAAEEALRRVDTEIAVTRRRLRALDKRWLPWLTAALTTLEMSLDQAEQEDGVRIRRAFAPRPERSSPP
jgi:V/A-type H+-transporting ATPase subunit D